MYSQHWAPILVYSHSNRTVYLQKDIVPFFLSQFDVWHHGIVNLQQAEDLLIGIVRKPMLRWTPGVFITPGTYHIYTAWHETTLKLLQV